VAAQVARERNEFDVFETMRNASALTYEAFWRRHEQDLPTLECIAFESGVINASAAACERQFSKAKRVLTKQRLSMRGDTLEANLLCSENEALMLRVLGLNKQVASLEIEE
jgi:hypothetical protein